MNKHKPAYSYLEVLEQIINCDRAIEMETLMDVIEDDAQLYTKKQQAYIGRALKEKYFKLRLREII